MGILTDGCEVATGGLRLDCTVAILRGQTGLQLLSAVVGDPVGKASVQQAAQGFLSREIPGLEHQIIFQENRSSHASSRIQTSHQRSF